MRSASYCLPRSEMLAERKLTLSVIMEINKENVWRELKQPKQLKTVLFQKVFTFDLQKPVFRAGSGRRTALEMVRTFQLKFRSPQSLRCTPGAHLFRNCLRFYIYCKCQIGNSRWGILGQKRSKILAAQCQLLKVTFHNQLTKLLTPVLHGKTW